MSPKKRTDGKNLYKTGFCANKQCEGTKPVNWKGSPMRICDQWEVCPCECHTLITEMCEMAGIERMLPEQSAEYLAHLRAERGDLVSASEVISAAYAGLSNVSDTDDHPNPSGVPTGQELAPMGTYSDHGEVGPRFAPTASGRRARGQLEEDVREVCEEYSLDVYDWPICTPKRVSERIAKKYAIEPPSTGAINAVWDRWEKLGFAKQDKKPSRFVCFETDGSARTLAMLKQRAKRDKKTTAREARHGVRR